MGKMNFIKKFERIFIVEQNLKARKHAHGRGQSAVGGQEMITTEGFFF